MLLVYYVSRKQWFDLFLAKFFLALIARHVWSVHLKHRMVHPLIKAAIAWQVREQLQHAAAYPQIIHVENVLSMHLTEPFVKNALLFLGVLLVDSVYVRET